MGAGGAAQGALGAELVAAVYRGGHPAVYELARTPFRPDWLAPPHRLAVEAAKVLADRGEAITLAAAVDEVTRQGGVTPSGTGQLRAAVEGALAAHLAQDAREVRAVVGELADLVAYNAPARSTRLLSVSEIFQPLPPIAWLCQALDMAPGAPILLAGYGFSGKTLAAQDLALAVASGSQAWGRFSVRAGRALHIDYEQGTRLSLERYQRLAVARGIDPRSLDGRLAFAPLPSWYLDGDVGDELERLATGFDLVVIDSFRAACPRTDENSSDARVPLDRLGRLSEATGATFLVIHHARKPSQNASGGARMSIRGSGALFDACGSVLVFAGEKGEPVTVEHEKARITGRPHDAFQLWIEDVEADGDPRGGLRVSVLEANPAATRSPSERFVALQDRILAVVQAQGGTFRGGSNLVARAVEARKSDVVDALDELMRQGRLTNAGSRQRPVFRCSGHPGTTSEAE